jgi:hypothetical protein
LSFEEIFGFSQRKIFTKTSRNQFLITLKTIAEKYGDQGLYKISIGHIQEEENSLKGTP